jgi:hypothetical protein
MMMTMTTTTTTTRYGRKKIPQHEKVPGACRELRNTATFS